VTKPIRETCGAEKQCLVCNSALRLGDKFCRRCGARQDVAIVECTVSDSSPTSEFSNSITDAVDRYKTAPLPSENLSHPISGSLIKALVPKIAPSLSVSKLSKKVIRSLMSVPVWLIIVLLSPLDAWVTTRELTKQL
jgi:hypothetical protein